MPPEKKKATVPLFDSGDPKLAEEASKEFGGEPVGEKEESEELELPVVLVTGVHGGALPQRAYDEDAGLDLHAAFVRKHPPGEIIRPGERTLIGTGIAVAIPEGHAGLVCPRSGLAVRDGVTVLNGPGVVDPAYRGEVCVPLINLGQKPVLIREGQRIAQLVIVPVTRVQPVAVESLPDTDRGEGGFGSTGE